MTTRSKSSTCEVTAATVTETAFPERPVLVRGDRLVVKVGSSLLTSHDEGLDQKLIDTLADGIAALLEQGIGVVLVSSGAVAEGVHRLGLAQRPQRLPRLQAAAAVGQAGLIDAYQRALGRHELQPALVLLTHADLASRERYLNASTTLTTLLELGVVPIVNENDTVATEEIRFGDNDTLGALVANLLQARALLMLTDRDGLYSADPGTDPTAERLPAVWADDPTLEGYCGAGSGLLGRGGMLTKVRAARQAARSGTVSIIADGRSAEAIPTTAAGFSLGTVLHPRATPLAARKSWLSGQLRVAGVVKLDSGAARAVVEDGSSLLPIGVTAVEGMFSRGELVQLQDPTGAVIAQGLSNYDHSEARQLCGVASAEIVSVLGYCNEHELVHRDNLVLLAAEAPRQQTTVVSPERPL